VGVEKREVVVETVFMGAKALTVESISIPMEERINFMVLSFDGLLTVSV